MKQAKFVAYEQNVIVYISCWNFAMSFASGTNHQASGAIASKQSFNFVILMATGYAFPVQF